ncbi:SMU1112c/YaeR family gloxylase I-like metalloprotein [Peribacillus muralis]|uniref:SMU1112c/YaeR family gloxylase I-like metalloprotein n=1 Tax=Peribacillus muralis TaxID=264697 RepID=UPI00382A946A
MKVNKIHHVAIICSDYEKSKKFYVNTLGCEIINETYRAERKSYKLDLLVGGAYQLELFSFPENPLRQSYPEARGLRHLAFEVDDIDQAIEELSNDNIFVEPIRVDEITGKRFTFFCDPDDLPLELYEK